MNKIVLKLKGVAKEVAEELCEDNNNSSVLPAATHVTQLTVTRSGVVTRVPAGAVARLAISLGAGRSHPSDTLDLAAGVELTVEPGDHVTCGQVWALVHHNKQIPPKLLAGPLST